MFRYHKPWDNILIESIPFVLKVDQPLESLFSKATWKEIHEIIEGKREMKSILTNYYDPDSPDR